MAKFIESTMKLKFLDSLIKRIVFSLCLSGIVILAAIPLGQLSSFSIFGFLLVGLIIFVPVSIFYAIASTFFSGDEVKRDNDILDDFN